MTEPDVFNRWMDNEYELPTRTSRLAIGSLVCSLIFCVPFLMPLLGIILGAASLAMITGRKNRLGGTGLATLGIIISFLFLAVDSYAAYYIWQWANKPAVTVSAMITDLENNDLQAARAYFQPIPSDPLTDEQLKDLAKLLSDNYGKLNKVSVDLSARLISSREGTMLSTSWDNTGWPIVPLHLDFSNNDLYAAVSVGENTDGDKNHPLYIHWLAFKEEDVIRVFPPQNIPAALSAVYNNLSWNLCKKPGQSKEDYKKALDLAQQACTVQPKNGTYLNTLGVAQYRMGMYEEALKTLKRSDKLNGEIPEDSAFLAMCYHQLGDEENAKKQLERLKSQLQPGRYGPEAEDFLEEAQKMIEGE
ncbi:MAG TPA: DUF4190 domain-containing protein [Phycisphaeraceae bacterium]|nr:DUF4190 domain-containing protein [Phycisphaeraceae bacterium]